MMGRIRLSDKSRGWRLPRAVLNRFLHCGARYLPMFPAMRDEDVERVHAAVLIALN